MLIMLAAFCTRLGAAPLSYQLQPQQIAQDTWLLQGRLEDFSNRNGGNIVNTAFVVTAEGVVVVDTGPSLRYGKALREAIAGITDKPVVRVFNTHHHPDHFLGNQAFSDVEILALPETGKQIAQQGNAFAENMYRMVGDWMRSTEVYLPTDPIRESSFTLGSHTFDLLPFSGHSGADLVIIDRQTGVLFASDIVFYQRALTTPHTPGLEVWLAEIEQMRAMTFEVMVPGHGPIVTNSAALDQMAAYLRWLHETLQRSAEAGLSMTEVIALPIKEEFKEIALSRNEFIRTVAHLYPGYEERAF
jgi:quinoprotein relay system zinc metallohydrolase 1